MSEFVYPFHAGGAEKRFFELARRFVAMGHEVHWFGVQDWPGAADTTYRGIRLHGVADPGGIYRPDGSRSARAALRLSFALTRALRAARVELDLIDCSLYPFFHIFGARLVRRRTPLVVTWHEFWGDYWLTYSARLGRFGRLVERYAARMADRILAVSELAATGLAGAGIPQDRMTTVYNGVAIAEIDAIQSAEVGADVVFFGRLKNHKNVDLLLRALAVAREEVPDLTCLIVGDGPERTALEQLAADLDLGEAVLFVGAFETEESLLRRVKACSVCVNPSTKEGGSSLTLLEANACGLPVIAIRHPLGIDDVLIEEGINGWWVDRGDPVSLAKTLVRALKICAADPGVRSRCHDFAHRFDWDELALRCGEAYREVAAPV